MLIACKDCALRRKDMFRRLSEAELPHVAGLKSEHRSFAPRANIIQEGTAGPAVFTLYEGWAYRHKSLAGGGRQILDFLLPGDMIGLHSVFAGRMRHSVTAVTQVSACVLAGYPFETLFEAQPTLTTAMIGALLQDRDRADARLLLLGRQRPTQRLAYLMLETRDRLRARQMGEERACDFPLTYDQMADALGLSRSQLARSLAELRDRGWATLSGGQLLFEDAGRMAGFCGYVRMPGRTPLHTLI
jgi:CRP-like cAMP-binding protein